jgi:phasin family protein
MGNRPVDAALHQFGDVQELAGELSRLLKCFILLHFGAPLHCGCNPLVQCTKIFLTRGVALPRIEFVAAHKPTPRNRSMATVANPLSGIAAATVDAAARLTRISMDSTERTIAVQLEYAKGAIRQATLTAKAVSQVKDVQGLLTLRTRIAENALENLMGYSRSLYEVGAEAQAELSKLAEERMSSFQQAVSESVDQAGRSAPAGGDVAVAAMKSSLAATTAAFDSFSKAAKHMASFTDAGVRAAGATKSRK